MNVEFNQDHRKIFGEKLLELANFAAAGLVLGQFVSGREFSIPVALIGILIVVGMYIFVYFILKRRQKK